MLTLRPGDRVTGRNSSLLLRVSRPGVGQTFLYAKDLVYPDGLVSCSCGIVFDRTKPAESVSEPHSRGEHSRGFLNQRGISPSVD